MTVILGRKEIRLGWEAGIALMVFLAPILWGGGAFTEKFLSKQEVIYAFVVQQAKKDSVQDKRIDANTADITANKQELQNVQLHTRYVTEIRTRQGLTTKQYIR